MARIRSVHPGLFTDEAFAQLSDAAQVFWIGLWTEADDQGVFEWKPVTLKMRLRGASTASVEPLLEELAAADCILRFEVGARSYGAVRNFCRFQRPKKPNAVHPMPPNIRTYVSSAIPSSEPDTPSGDRASPPDAPNEAGKVEPVAVDPPLVPHQFPTGGEKSPQMEDGGGRREEPSLRSGRDAPAPLTNPKPPDPVAEPAPDARTALFRDGLAALRRMTGKSEPPARALLGKWLKAAGDDAAGLLDAIRQAEDLRPADPVAWLAAAAKSRGSTQNGAPVPAGLFANAARDALLGAYPALADEAGCTTDQGPPGWWGAVDWIATLPDVQPGTIPRDPALGLRNAGARMPAVNGYLLPRAVMEVCGAAGIPVDARPKLDAIATWCRQGLDFDAPEALGAIARQAARMREQGDAPHSLAVFGQAVRGACGRGEAA